MRFLGGDDKSLVLYAIALQEVLVSEEIGEIDGLIIDQFASQLEMLT